MKSREWCKEYLEKKYSREVTKEEVDNLLETLLTRVNRLTGKCYGKKKFTGVKLPTVGRDFEEFLNAKYEEYNALVEEKETLEKEIEEDKSSEDYFVNLKKQKSLGKKQYELAMLNKKIDGFKVGLEDFQYYKIPWDEYSEDSEEEQKLCEELEGYLFEILLDKIDEKTIKQLRKDMWEILEEQDRETIINILNGLKYSGKWMLTTQDLEVIKFKLKYPKAYRVFNEKNEVEETEESNLGMFNEDNKDKSTYTEYLRKGQPEVYALIRKVIKRTEIERKSLTRRKKLKEEGRKAYKRGMRISHIMFM